MLSRIFEALVRRIDGPLMAALALTLALGLTVVYSAGGASLDRVAGQARKLAMAILVENGGHGGDTAAPIARQVFDYYLLGKMAEKKPTLEPKDDEEND